MTERDREYLHTMEILFHQRCEELNIHDWMFDLKEQCLPENVAEGTMQLFNGFYNYNNHDYWNLSCYAVRELAILYSGFSMVTVKVADALAEYMKKYSNKKMPRVLDLGSGRGVWTKALSDRGIDIQAFDLFKGDGMHHYNNMWIDDTICMDMREAVKIYGKNADFLLCSWPSLDGCIDEIPKLMYEANPNTRMVHIGEGIEGCTGNERFYSTSRIVDPMYSVNDAYCRWDGIYDSFSLREYDPEGEKEYDDLMNKLEE